MILTRTHRPGTLYTLDSDKLVIECKEANEITGYFWGSGECCNGFFCHEFLVDYGFTFTNKESSFDKLYLRLK